VFFFSSLALLVFAVSLGWVPLQGATTAFVSMSPLERVGDVVHHLVLPASVMALQFAAANYLLMRGGMVSELGSDHLLLGRAKGLRERRLKYGYAARNALLPVVTQASVQLAVAVAIGVVFIERVFAYPGMGKLLFDALAQRDYPVLQACFLVFAVTTVTLNFVAEVLYARLDPRTRG
jgi:peptide/nickel transport system permease protein